MKVHELLTKHDCVDDDDDGGGDDDDDDNDGNHILERIVHDWN